jgi:hypothetical protein
MPQCSEFTWDWIIDSCQQHIEILTQSIGQDPQRSHQAQENYRRGFEALILAVAELREHPQLVRNVPMKSLGTLRWFPTESYEVNVYYDVSKLRYQVSIYEHDRNNRYGVDTLIEQKKRLSQ